MTLWLNVSDVLKEWHVNAFGSQPCKLDPCKLGEVLHRRDASKTTGELGTMIFLLWWCFS